MVSKKPALAGKPTLPRERNWNSFERKHFSKVTRKKILISCGPTAGAYFSGLIQDLELTECTVLNICQSENPLTITENTIQFYTKHEPFYRVYALVCLDDDNDEQWRQAQNHSKNHPICEHTIFRLVTSIPSFDLWLLLHSQNISIEKDPTGSLATWIKHNIQPLLATVGKDQNLFLAVKSGLPDALQRSRNLLRLRNRSINKLPLTEIHDLVTFLLRLKNRQNRL